jgi:hypothetical protein
MGISFVFGIVVAALTIGILIAFGYQQLDAFMKMQRNAQILKALDDLGEAVDNVHGLGGESSDDIRLGFPASVEKVCFIPVYSSTGYMNPRRQLETDIKSVIDTLTGAQKTQLAELLVEVRFEGDKDKNHSVLIFIEDGTVPRFEYIEHLKPEKKDGKVLCVSHGEKVWLVRRYNKNGAWVDVELP